MCEVCDMVIVNGTDIARGKWTWRGNGGHYSVIDYVVVSSEAIERVEEMMVWEEKDMGSDHNMIEVKWKIPTQKKEEKGVAEKKEIKIWAMPEGEEAEETWKRYEEVVGVNMRRWIEERKREGEHKKKNVNDIWMSFKEEMMGAVHMVIGEKTVKKKVERKKTCSKEEKERRKERRKTHEQWRKMEEGEEKNKMWDRFVILRREVAKMVKKRWREEQEKLYEKMEERNGKERWKVINEMRGKKSKERVPDKVKRADGKMTESEEETMNEWKKYFEALGKLDVKDKKFD